MSAPKIYLNSGTGVFTETSTPLGTVGGTLDDCANTDRDVSDLSCGDSGHLIDANSDGHLDIVILSKNRADLWLGDGAANFQHKVQKWNPNREIGEVWSPNGFAIGGSAVCDIDNDGILGTRRC